MDNSGEYLPSLLDTTYPLDSDERRAQNICDFLNLTNVLEADVILPIVNAKLQSRYSLFDLAMYRAKMDSGSVGMLIKMLHYAKDFIDDLSFLVEACLDQHYDSETIEKSHEDLINVDDVMAKVLSINAGMWKCKPVNKLSYEHPFLEPDQLYPERNVRLVRSDDSDVVQDTDFVHQLVEGNSEIFDDYRLPDKASLKRSRGRPKKLSYNLSGKHLCKKCGKYLSGRYGMIHEEKCEGFPIRHPKYKRLDNGSFKCAVEDCTCESVFVSITGIRRHFHKHHVPDSEKYFRCEFCTESFSIRSAYTQHVAIMHKKRYTCKWCSKLFGSKCKMEEHARIHTGERPFRCSRCEYSSSKLYNLEVHMKCKHNEDLKKKLKCEYCPKQFASLGRFMRHMKNAHPDKPSDLINCTRGGGMKKRDQDESDEFTNGYRDKVMSSTENQTDSKSVDSIPESKESTLKPKMMTIINTKVIPSMTL